MNQRKLIVGGLVAATTVGLTFIIRHYWRGKKQVQQSEYVEEKEQGNPVQQSLPYMDDKELAMVSEFEKFRNTIDTVSRLEFDENYGKLREILQQSPRQEEANQVGLVFISSVVLRNRMENIVFTETTQYLLEGNSELLPSAIEEAVEDLDEELQFEAVEAGKKAMDCIISGVAREQFRYASVH